MTQVTPITVTKPPTTAQWLERLDNLRSLPLLPDTPNRVLAAINHPNATADSVAQVIKTDPVLCLHLFDSANRIVSKTGNEIKHLAHLISLLGLPNVAQQVRSAPVISEANPGYLDVLIQSQLNTALTSRLAPLKGLNADELFFPSLLLLVPLWALWHNDPKQMEQRQGLLANPTLNTEHIDKLTLGLPLQELVKALLQNWSMPQPCHDIWHMDPAFTLKTMAALHTQKRAAFLQQHPQQEVALQSSNWLILCSQLCASQHLQHWHHRRSYRAQFIVAELLHQPQKNIAHQLHQAAISCPWFGSALAKQHIHPAARLLMNWQAAKVQPCYSLTVNTPASPAAHPATNTPSAASASSIPSHSSNKVLLKANLERLSERGSSFSNLNQLLGVLVSTLHEGVGLEQVMLLTLNRQRDKLQSHLSIGVDPNSPLRSLRIALSPNTQRGIVGKLLQQPSGLLINQQNRQAALKSLPPELIPHLPDTDFALMSLFHDKQAIGLAMATNATLDKSDYRHFKHCCQAGSQAVTAFAHSQYRNRRNSDRQKSQGNNSA